MRCRSRRSRSSRGSTVAPATDPCVDAHAHLVPPALVDAIERSSAKLPSVGVHRDDATVTLTLPGLGTPRPIPPVLLDRARSHAWMDDQGIDVQVVGVWADLFGYGLPAGEAAYWHRLLNDLLQEEAAASGRMVPLATLPLQDTALAISELERVLAAGYRGVTIGCSAGADELDADRLDELWAALAEHRVPVVMHPGFHAGDPRTRVYGMPNTLGRAYDTDVAVARLLYSGRLAGHPGLRILLMHGGGAVPYLWGRLQRNHALDPGGLADPATGIDALWFDSIVYRERALSYLLDFAGADRVLLGSDYPFPIMDPEPLRVVRDLDPAPDVRQRICSGNAHAFFGLPTPA
ncbi:MAG: amidohydrolase family protein [Streptosporangiales bacterium]|nr:amidohydrolase family protein [Streptosporangiales bacterium]